MTEPLGVVVGKESAPTGGSADLLSVETFFVDGVVGEDVKGARGSETANVFLVDNVCARHVEANEANETSEREHESK